MVHFSKVAFIGSVAAMLFASVAADDDSYTIVQDCGAGFGSCPSNKPCCSQYGQCGIGAFCLGGCDPNNSFKLQSCVAAPVCKSKKHVFGGKSTIASKAKYLGDSSKADWVVDGTTLDSGSDLLLTMPPNTVGTVMASSTYVWYGKVSATMKSSRGNGVVSAFILMSDMKDEIDFEWVGADLGTTQTNYYFHAYPDYTNTRNITTDDTFDQFHTYTIDWKEDVTTWSVDGVVGRTLLKSDTLNKTSGLYRYPQTPSRVQLSLWPGGLASNAKGTVDWAGGEIDWTTNAADLKDPGYYYVTIKDITVECYDAPSSAVIAGTKAYSYNDRAGLESNVIIGNNATVLSSFLGSGTNLDTMPETSGSSAAEYSGVATVPGNFGSGSQAGDLINNSGTTSNTGSDGQGGNNDGSNPSNGGSSFSQGVSAASVGPSAGLKGSVFAIVVAVAGMLVL